MNGDPIVLNEMEVRSVNNAQKMVSNAGFDVDVTTLTTIMKSVIEQKFFEIPFADYMPVKVGEGAWSEALTSYLSFSLSDDFASGVLNTGADSSRMGSADTAVDSITVKVYNWAKKIGWSLFDLQLATRSGNWDLVTQKEKARKKSWDLGLQKLAFLGMTSNSTNVPGLLSQSGVTADTSLIPKLISAMTDAEFTTFVTGLYEAYRNNAKRTAKPTHFIIPERDFNGLVAPYSATYPLKTKLQALQEAFETLTMNKNFKILPLAYANYTESGLSKNIYTLLNYDEDSLRLDIPVNYTNTLANSVDNFWFQNVGYGQFTAPKAYRPAEMIYFTNTVA